MNIRTSTRLALIGLVLAGAPRAALASKVGWMDDVVRRIVRSSDPDLVRPGTRFFEESAESSLETLARRSDVIARTRRGADEAAGAVLETRFARLVGSDPDSLKTFRALEPAEKRLVLRMGEAAEELARTHPENADELIRSLGVEGMTAVRVYGTDVAEVIAREGPESVNVLRKSGRAGWGFYTETVLKHKKKLAAAGVLGLFLADPDRFIDSAGKVTEYAVNKFSEAGIDLAGAIGAGAARGLERSMADRLGVDGPLARWAIGIAAAGAGIVALLVLVGAPMGWFFRAVSWPFRLVGKGLRSTVRST